MGKLFAKLLGYLGSHPEVIQEIVGIAEAVESAQAKKAPGAK